jgi:hypothetical protein
MNYQFLDTAKYLNENIKRNANVNNAEININVRKNRELLPEFKYYKSYDNLNFISKIIPDYKYKNKQLFNADPNIQQTEQDEIGIDINFLDRYTGLNQYGLYKYQNQSFPELRQHRITPKSNIYELDR